jgi:hypothetical protein
MAAVTLAALTGFGQGALADSDKVTICHKGVQTAAVPNAAVPGHVQHGDTLGACGAPPPPAMAAVVMMRCEPQGASGVLVVSASSSPAPADPADAIAVDDDCAAVLGDLLDAGYELRSVTTGSAGDAVLHLYTDYLLIGRVPAVP